MPIKIGLLLPRSDVFPTLSRDILQGIKLNFQNKESDMPSFIIEGVGNAADDSNIKTTEKLLLQEGVDIIIGFCSVFKLKELTDVINAYKKPFIHIDLGGRILKKEYRSPYIIHHTLNFWQSAYVAGKYAVNTFGKKGVIIGSYYDSGYQITEGFLRGLEEAGGTIARFWVGTMDYKAETYDTMFEVLREEKPDFVYAQFSYKEGEKVIEKLAASDFNGKLPIITNPLMTEEVNQYHDIKKVISIASWSFDDVKVEMKSFCSEYKNQCNEDANIMSLLGFEVGQLLSEKIDNKHVNQGNIGDFFLEKQLKTPRGKLQFNALNESFVDDFKVRELKYINDNYINKVIDQIRADEFSNQNEKFEESPYMGWQNPYICT